jgi:EAL domain-containing protein (putative c-di-GMP-specific phosphodiesterase class I)
MLIKKFNPKNLVLEIVETSLMMDIVAAKKVISELHDLGVKIAIDDFGAGHSNFERLLSFQPDILKLDGSLIKNIHQNKYSRDIVETIKTFADKKNIKTVAEFVSSKEVYDVVIEIGIDYLHGFYLGEPSEELALEALNI